MHTHPPKTHTRTNTHPYTHILFLCLPHTHTYTHTRAHTDTHTHTLSLPAITNVLFVLYIQAELFLNEHRQQVELTTSKFRLGNPRRILGIHLVQSPQLVHSRLFWVAQATGMAWARTCLSGAILAQWPHVDQYLLAPWTTAPESLLRSLYRSSRELTAVQGARRSKDLSVGALPVAQAM